MPCCRDLARAGGDGVVVQVQFPAVICERGCVRQLPPGQQQAESD